MLQIVLIRPGSTEFDREGRIQGNLDVPLSEEGVAEVEQVGAALTGEPIKLIYSCACQAARQTADLLGKQLGVSVKSFDKLRNLDHGLWQGLCLDEVKRKQPRVFKQWQEQPETVCPPGGEMLDDARQRVEAVLAKIMKKHKQGVVALVLPEPLAGLAHNCLAHQPDAADVMKAVAPGAVWQTSGVDIAAHTSS